jgi:hypothetical protein
MQGDFYEKAKSFFNLVGVPLGIWFGFDGLRGQRWRR